MLDEPEDLIELIMYECATFLDEFRDAGVGDHILDVFDSTTALRVWYPTSLCVHLSLVIAANPLNRLMRKWNASRPSETRSSTARINH